MIGRGRGRYRGHTVLGRVSPDILAPSIPQNLAVTSFDYDQVALQWDASTDTGGSGLSHYIVYQNDVDVAHVNAPTVTKTVTGLTELTSYTFKVSAVDFAGNESAKSTGVTQKTKYQISKAAEYFVGSNVVYYTITDNVSLSAGSSGTKQTWVFRVYFDAVSNGLENFIMNKIGFAGNHEYSMKRENTGAARDLRMYINSAFGGVVGVWNSVFTAATTWYTIVLVYDGDQATAADRMKMYLNGAAGRNVDSMAAGTWPAAITRKAQNLIVGTLSGAESTYRMDGRFADFQFYDYALNATEAGDVFNRILPATAPDTWLRFHNDDDGDSSAADGDAGGAVNQVIDAQSATTGVISGTLDGWRLVAYP